MISFFGKHPTAANLLMIILSIIGLISLPQLRRETFPDYASGKLEINAAYPGATSLKIEEAVCQRIEDAIDGVNFIEEIKSEAMEGLGKIVVEMKENGDFQRFMDDIRTEVEAIDDFPDQVETPIIKALNQTDPVVTLAVSGDMAPYDLKFYLEEIKKKLQLDYGISLVDIEGFSDHQIRIQIPSQILMQYGLSLNSIADIISKQSIDMPAGTITTSQQEVIIRFSDERKTPLEFENLIVVAGPKGNEIRLGDIAKIIDTFEKDEEKVIIDGQRGALLKISKSKSEDSLRIMDKIKDFIKNEDQIKPKSIKFSLTQDYSTIVRDRLKLLLNNGWQGFVLVFFTMWLFFSLKFSFWVVMGLPVSFLGALFFLPQINYSINMLTMVGMLIALGLLMDDAIVIAENVATNLKKGQSPLNAAIFGTDQVKIGVLSSFLTTLCIFGPISFMQGNIGKILKAIPIVLILVLSVSLIEAFCILPHHLAHSLKDHNNKKTSLFRIRFDNFIDWIKESICGKIVDSAVNWRYLTLGITIALFIASVGIIKGGVLKFEAFPDIDGDIIVSRILLPQGTPLKKTESVITKVTQALKVVNNAFKPAQPDQKDLVKNVIVLFSSNNEAHEKGPHVATIFVDLLSAENRNARIDDILSMWRKEVGDIPDVINISFDEPLIPIAGLPIEIRIKGDDLSLLKKASIEMYNWISLFKGVYNLTDDLRPGKPEIQIKMKQGAFSLGLNAQIIAAQLRSAFYGKTACEIQVNEESYEIDVRVNDENKDSLEDLDYFYVTLADGNQVPLQSVAVMERTRGYARVVRVNGQRTVTIQGSIDPKETNASEIINKIQQDFLPEFLNKYKSLRVSIVGEHKESKITQSSLKRGFIIGLIGIFIILSFQFKSYIEPVVVMIAIPFALIGIVFGHIIMGYNLCMPSMVGFVSLAGIVVNDSILLVEFIKKRINEGMSITEASCNASRDRFRAVMLTSLTTVAGLLPLLYEKSLQAQFLIPLAISIIFGILASTLLVIIVIPSCYTILNDLKKYNRNLYRKY